MDNQQLKTAQRAMFLIAKEIRRVCDKNKITYSMAFGTMIGILRHKGFIPWDDDLDMTMERKEYERFIRCCETDLGEDFVLQTPETDPDYPWPFLKVRLKGTKFKSEWDNDSRYEGVWVDVFPIDKAPKSALRLKLMNIRYKAILRALHIKAGITGYLDQGAAKKLLRAILSAYGRLFSKERLMQKLNAICTRYTFREDYESGYVFSVEALYNRLPESIFDSYIEGEFEGERFLMAAGYDQWLKLEYGAYMELPPKEQRENHHKIAQFEIPTELLDRIEAQERQKKGKHDT